MPSRGVLVDQASSRCESHTSPRTSLSLLRVRSDRSLGQPRLSSELKKGECCDVRTAAGEHVRQVRADYPGGGIIRIRRSRYRPLL